MRSMVEKEKPTTFNFRIQDFVSILIDRKYVWLTSTCKPSKKIFIQKLIIRRGFSPLGQVVFKHQPFSNAQWHNFTSVIDNYYLCLQEVEHKFVVYFAMNTMGSFLLHWSIDYAFLHPGRLQDLFLYTTLHDYSAKLTLHS